MFPLRFLICTQSWTDKSSVCRTGVLGKRRPFSLTHSWPHTLRHLGWGPSEPGCRGAEVRGPHFCNGRRVFLCSLSGSSSGIDQGLTSPPCAEVGTRKDLPLSLTHSRSYTVRHLGRGFRVELQWSVGLGGGQYVMGGVFSYVPSQVPHLESNRD